MKWLNRKAEMIDPVLLAPLHNVLGGMEWFVQHEEAPNLEKYKEMVASLKTELEKLRG